MYSTTHDATTDSARCSGPDEKILPAPGTNQMVGFAEFDSAHWEKDKIEHLNIYKINVPSLICRSIFS